MDCALVVFEDIPGKLFNGFEVDASFSSFKIEVGYCFLEIEAGVVVVVAYSDCSGTVIIQSSEKVLWARIVGLPPAEIIK